MSLVHDLPSQSRTEAFTLCRPFGLPSSQVQQDVGSHSGFKRAPERMDKIVGSSVESHPHGRERGRLSRVGRQRWWATPCRLCDSRSGLAGVCPCGNEFGRYPHRSTIAGLPLSDCNSRRVLAQGKEVPILEELTWYHSSCALATARLLPNRTQLVKGELWNSHRS